MALLTLRSWSPLNASNHLLFQQETYKDDDDKKTKEQPDFQLVFEVPDIFTYKRTSPKSWQAAPADFTSKKRIHRYSSDVTRSSKRGKQETGVQLQLPAKSKWAKSK